MPGLEAPLNLWRDRIRVITLQYSLCWIPITVNITRWEHELLCRTSWYAFTFRNYPLYKLLLSSGVYDFLLLDIDRKKLMIVSLPKIIDWVTTSVLVLNKKLFAWKISRGFLQEKATKNYTANLTRKIVLTKYFVQRIHSPALLYVRLPDT